MVRTCARNELWDFAAIAHGELWAPPALVVSNDAQASEARVERMGTTRRCETAEPSEEECVRLVESVLSR